MNDKVVVELRDVSVSYDNNEAISNISITITGGEIVTIIGPNGAGKSTLVKTIAGLTYPSKGAVFRPHSSIVGYVPQRLFIDKSMPLKVSRFLRLAQSRKSNCREALERVNASQLWSKQVHSLSGGELQRVLLARAISRAPDLLLLDEPLQGVDVGGQIQLYQLISDIRQELNCAVVMVSHDLHLVMAQTDHVVCLNHHICCEGKPESISTHPEYIRLFGTHSANSIAVYTHHHDHHHDIEGNVERCNAACNHD